jgi:hypothetical protein
VTDVVDPFIAKLRVGEEGNLRTKAWKGSTRHDMGSGGGDDVRPVPWPMATRQCAGQWVRGERVAPAYGL